MKPAVQLWRVALVCFLVFQVSGASDERESDDWRVSTILESTVDQYIKPYTGGLVEKVTSSSIWNVFGRTINRVQGAINWTGGYLHAYYQDHLKAPTENTLHWIENKTMPIVERVRGRFQANEQ